MAIDTRDKRASAVREGLLPFPDGAALNQGDRQEVLWQYRGILAARPITGGAGNDLRVGVVRGGYVSDNPSIGGQF